MTISIVAAFAGIMMQSRHQIPAFQQALVPRARVFDNNVRIVGIRIHINQRGIPIDGKIGAWPKRPMITVLTATFCSQSSRVFY